MDISRFLKKHRTVISACVTIAGVGATVYSAIKESPKVKEVLEEYKEHDVVPTKKEKARVIVTGFKKTFIFGGLTVANILYSVKAETKEKLAYHAALAAGEKMLTDYRNEIKKTVGEEKEKDIHEKSVVNNMVEPSVIPGCKDDEVMYYEPITARYFACTRERLDAAVNEVNRLLNMGDEVMLNSFFDELDLERSDAGDVLGWDLRFDGLVTVSCKGHVSEDGKVPAIAIVYNVPPAAIS